MKVLIFNRKTHLVIQKKYRLEESKVKFWLAQGLERTVTFLKQMLQNIKPNDQTFSRDCKIKEDRFLPFIRGRSR